MNENQNNGTQFETQKIGEGFYGDSGVERVSGKGKGTKIAAISGISAAVVIGGLGAAYAFSDFVKNQVKLRISSPENYYAWVYENNTNEISKKVSENYAESLKRYEKGSSTDMKFSYIISESLKDELQESLEEIGLDNIASDIKSASLDINCAVNKGNVSYDLGLDYNDSRLFSVDAFVQGTGEYLFKIPELKDRWISFDVSSMSGMSEMYNSYSKLMADPESYLSATDVENEINRYVGIWSDMTKDVTVEKSEELDICDIKVKYTVAQVDITAQLSKDFIIKIADELENDDVMKKLIVDGTGAITADEYSESVNSIRETAESITGAELETVSFKTYIDPKGVIRGFAIETPDGEIINAVLGKEDKKIRGEFNFFDGDSDKVRAEFKADEVANDTYDGKLVVTEDEETVSVTFDDLKIVDKTKGYAEGTVNINAGEETVKIDLSSDGNSQKMTYDLNVQGENYGTLEFSYTVNDTAEVSVPDKSGAFVISGDNDDIAFEDFASEEETSAFISSILQKIGFSGEIADETAESYASMLYGGGYSGYDDYEAYEDYDDYDEFDDDYDFDESDFDSGEELSAGFVSDNENLNRLTKALLEIDYENLTDEDIEELNAFFETFEDLDTENLTDEECEKLLAEIEKIGK